MSEATPGPSRPARPRVCPTCKRPVAEASRWLPFCSDRCKMVDLGGWFLGKFRIPAVEDDDVVVPDTLPDDVD